MIKILVIKFSAYGPRLRRITSGIIPTGSYGKLKFEFDFRTDDWDSVKTKTANFYYKGTNHPVHLDKHNQCFVPKEVIYTPSFSVAVHGGDIVTNTVKLSVDGNATINPSIYDEVMKIINEHTHEEYITNGELEDVLLDAFDADRITEEGVDT